MRILALVPDAFGGHGGMALYNRDFLSALCEHPECEEVVALPRVMPMPAEPLPEKLRYRTSGLGGRARYLTAALGQLMRDRSFDLIVCGHIALVPVALALRPWLRAPVLLELYGIDAWAPMWRRLIGRVDAFVSISEVTKQRFLHWSGVEARKVRVLPNAIHAKRYGPGPKPAELVSRYGLEGRSVLLTVGRMWIEERGLKGFDRVMRLLPNLANTLPNVAYLIVGDGDGRSELEEEARRLGVADRVIFTGRIPEDEKSAHYRLADVYVMPGRGDGFGFVFLEALACGVPVVASKADGSREAVRGGELGELVDPDDLADIEAGILAALERPRAVPEGLDYFSFENFSQRLHGILDDVLAARTTAVE
jgi:glycosyltransferase involved in cell wall biosynthesis